MQDKRREGGVNFLDYMDRESTIRIQHLESNQFLRKVCAHLFIHSFLFLIKDMAYIHHLREEIDAPAPSSDLSKVWVPAIQVDLKSQISILCNCLISMIECEEIKFNT